MEMPATDFPVQAPGSFIRPAVGSGARSGVVVVELTTLVGAVRPGQPVLVNPFSIPAQIGLTLSRRQHERS